MSSSKDSSHGTSAGSKFLRFLSAVSDDFVPIGQPSQLGQSAQTSQASKPAAAVKPQVNTNKDNINNNAPPKSTMASTPVGRSAATPVKAPVNISPASPAVLPPLRLDLVNDLSPPSIHSHLSTALSRASSGTFHWQRFSPSGQLLFERFDREVSISFYACSVADWENYIECKFFNNQEKCSATRIGPIEADSNFIASAESLLSSGEGHFTVTDTQDLVHFITLKNRGLFISSTNNEEELSFPLLSDILEFQVLDNDKRGFLIRQKDSGKEFHWSAESRRSRDLLFLCIRMIQKQQDKAATNSLQDSQPSGNSSSSSSLSSPSPVDSLVVSSGQSIKGKSAEALAIELRRLLQNSRNAEKEMMEERERMNGQNQQKTKELEAELEKTRKERDSLKEKQNGPAAVQNKPKTEKSDDSATSAALAELLANERRLRSELSSSLKELHELRSAHIRTPEIENENFQLNEKVKAFETKTLAQEREIRQLKASEAEYKRNQKDAKEVEEAKAKFEGFKQEMAALKAQLTQEQEHQGQLNAEIASLKAECAAAETRSVAWQAREAELSLEISRLHTLNEELLTNRNFLKKKCESLASQLDRMIRDKTHEFEFQHRQAKERLENQIKLGGEGKAALEEEIHHLHTLVAKFQRENAALAAEKAELLAMEINSMDDPPRASATPRGVSSGAFRAFSLLKSGTKSTGAAASPNSSITLKSSGSNTPQGLVGSGLFNGPPAAAGTPAKSSKASSSSSFEHLMNRVKSSVDSIGKNSHK